MYLYFLSKKTQDAEALWEKTKGKYKESRKTLTLSLEDYISASGKRNREERIFVAALILESVTRLPFLSQAVALGGLKKDDFGKPYFDASDLKISIAHNEDFALVAYDEGAEIGVDIEGEIAPEKAEKLAERFAAISSLKTENSLLEISAFEMMESCDFEPVKLTTADEGFTAKWTAAEAVMKCDGRGFSALPELENIKKSIKVNGYILEKNKKKAYISVAKKQ